MTDDEIKRLIREALPAFERKVASGEIVVRKLEYTKPRGPSIRPDPGELPLVPLPRHVSKVKEGEW